MRYTWRSLLCVTLVAAMMYCGVAETNLELEMSIDEANDKAAKTVTVDGIDGISIDDVYESLPQDERLLSVNLDLNGLELSGLLNDELIEAKNEADVISNDTTSNGDYVGSGRCGDDLIWTLDSEGILTISGTGRMWDFVESTECSEFDYHECPWIKLMPRIKKIIFEDGITYVGADAFNQYDSYDDWCNPTIEEVHLSETIKEIGPCAFRYLRKLKKIDLPSQLESIGQEAFAYSGIESITIPGTVSYIGGCICDFCDNLQFVLFEAKHTEGMVMGNCPFRACPSLIEIQVEKGHKILHSHNGVLFFENTLMQYPCGGKNNRYDIEPGCTKIFPEAFTGASNLETISIPHSLKEIMDRAFFWFSDIPLNLKNVEYEGSEDEWKEIRIGSDNEPLTDASITFLNRPDRHTPVTDPAVAPTLNNTGLTEGSHCSVCGKVLVKQKTVPKLISIKKCKITGINDAVYTGKAIVPAPVAKYNGKKLVRGRDYTVAYEDNKSVGKATVTITGIGKYGDVVNKTFKINPKAVALYSVTPGTKKLTVKWKKGTDVSGYEVQYSLKKSFASAKKVNIKQADTVKTEIRKLLSNKTYYVRIRAYKTVEGKKYYSAWSDTKSAKTKK